MSLLYAFHEDYAFDNRKFDYALNVNLNFQFVREISKASVCVCVCI